MAPQVLHRVIYGTTTPSPTQVSRLTIAPALLSGYVRHKVRYCDYPAIIPSSKPGACVRGTFVQGLTEGDQWRLDLFEGSQYKRVEVQSRLLREEGEGGLGGEVEEGKQVRAETYVWKDGVGELEDGEWDFEVFRREKMGRWVGSEEEYEEVDEAVKGGKDPLGGRSMNGHVGEQLEASIKKEADFLESAV
ncbi:hypothetical protein MMC21_006078 [Puttea exsequens]|nr:hypothetical protein [Puttea exsequens]